MSAEFVDTNVLIYSQDRTAGEKQGRAAQLLRQLVGEGAVAISTQVLVEFYSAATRKIGRSGEEIEAVLRTMAAWRLHRPDLGDVLAAAELRRRYQMAWWDALLVQSALAMGCTKLWSEDLQHGMRIEGLEIRNPFVE